MLYGRPWLEENTMLRKQYLLQEQDCEPVLVCKAFSQFTRGQQQQIVWGGERGGRVVGLMGCGQSSDYLCVVSVLNL
jgi:hypothetical protein